MVVFIFKMAEILQMGGSIWEWEEHRLDLEGSTLESYHGMAPRTTMITTLYNNQLDRRYVIWNIRLHLYYLGIGTDLNLDLHLDL